MVISLRRSIAAAVVLATLAGGAPGAGPAGAATPADRCYTAALHEVFLGRPASVYDIEAWTDRYAPAPARPALPRALARSDEWLEAVVVGIYDAALDRAPDPDGLAFWVGRLRAGTRVATLTAQVYGSDEVWARGGGTAEGFVEDVYPRIMGRAASEADVAYWSGELGHRGPGGVAKALLGSIENRRDRVTGLYQEILGRAPDAGGRDYWAGRLATLDDVALAVELASSPEAHQRAQVGCALPPAPTTTVVTDGDRSSLAPQISADGRFVAFVSDARDLVPGDVQDAVRDLFLWDRATDTTTKVTDTPSIVLHPTISADGRHVAYATIPPEDIASEQSFEAEIYTWDRQTGTTTRVTEGDGTSLAPTLSADGRYIAFGSASTDLVAGDDNGVDDVFVWDRTTEAIERISDGAGDVVVPVMSADGEQVAYGYQDPVVPPGEASGIEDVYLWERAGGTTTRVLADATAQDFAADGDLLHTYGSRSGLALRDGSSGAITTIVPGRGDVDEAVIAADGSSVAFASIADGIVPEDHDAGAHPFSGMDAFVWERATGTIVRLSDDATVASRPTISADGRHIAYEAAPPPGPTSWADITVWDRGS